MRKTKDTKSKTEYKTDLLRSNGMFEDQKYVKENQQNETKTSGESDINTLKDSQKQTITKKKNTEKISTIREPPDK